VITDDANLESLRTVILDEPRKLTVLSPDSCSAAIRAQEFGRHRCLGNEALNPSRGGFVPREPHAESVAYLLFTSGTTGTPKGIGIQQSNVLAYITGIAAWYGIEPCDRFSQNFEITFDLSVHDMFVCWSRGASLNVPSERVAIAPAKFIRDRQLTCWFSTPSTAAMMLRLGMLRAGAFPSLRWSLFCGEPLKQHLAEAWQGAAANSTVENLYGPTEATIACTAYRYCSQSSAVECVNGIVPIGRPFGGTLATLVNDRCEPVKDGEVGELLLAGLQIAPGYWSDQERTSTSFISSSSLSHSGPWYRTGDLASKNKQGNLIYRGRRDGQIKVLGHRVELQEIEAVALEASGAQTVVALGWPQTAAGADEVILFLTGSGVSDDAILEALKRKLPVYMVPKTIHRLEAMPLSSNQKIDTNELIRMRESMA
jgi:amino acid adenylation domain-containing protein